MQSDFLSSLKAKQGAIITGLFLETYLFQGQDTSKSLGALLQGVGLLLTFPDGGSLWLHSASSDGQSLNLTIDDDLNPIPQSQTVLVDLGEELGKSVLIDVSASAGYCDFIGQPIARISLIRQSRHPSVINGVVIETLDAPLLFFIEADEGHVGMVAESMAALEQYGYKYQIEIV